MLTSDQINTLKDAAGRMTDSVNKYIIEDICRRLAKSGKITATAEYLTYRAQTLGKDYEAIKREISQLSGLSVAEIEQLYTAAAAMDYSTDIARLGASAIPFEDNAQLQQITRAAVNLAQDDFTNITQTIGMVDPTGKELPLREFYRSSMDWVFKNVSTGAMDYNTAMRKASMTLAEKGLTAIEYESGVVTSLEAAVRRNVMGGLGLMAEQVSRFTHDELGANGWEMSAHANSAEDHEPHQGRQYTDAEWAELNGTAEKPGTLKRRIGTLNCGHYASPIIIGVNEPLHSDAELKKFREDNAAGVTIDGKHYTGYEATQRQRELERRIRYRKRQNLAANASGDKERQITTAARLNNCRRAYKEFSDKAGLRVQEDRQFVAGFNLKEAGWAAKAG